ncbi:WD40 repeat domain-containing protein [Trichocoleus sp. FACHB-591]|uniref:WD40 repeat domain-containing protein n=1 Tax=Trichocoleus sp. FACHB-591 TaxID=2692872 RepID=UPI00168450AD|nr:WD40 repeat domain-containing protein [Trichocoleus sp. FACHB-591]MBD2096390.1 WD40 repeat domain-containing protein [Trichocoleus sp. FACHB-591]
MTHSPNQPRQDDLILGGQVPPTGAVLGGLAGIRQRLTSAVVEHQIAALSETLRYGQPGIDLVIQVLLEAKFPNSEQLQPIAYSLLYDRPEPTIQVALRTYNPYPYFQCLATYSHDGYSFVRSVILSPDGQTLISRGDFTIKVWNLKTGRIILTLEPPLPPGDISDAIANLYPHLRIWGMRDGVIPYHPANDDEYLAIFPDGQTIATCGKNREILLWNCRTKMVISKLVAHLSLVTAVAVTPNGQTLISGGYDKTIRIWDAVAHQLSTTLEAHTGEVWSLAVSTDGQTFVSASEDRTIRVWDVQTGEERYTLRGHTDSVSAIAISIDGKILVSGSADRTVKVWNLQTGQELQTFTGHTHYIMSVAISADKQRIVSGSRDGTIKMWGIPSVV